MTEKKQFTFCLPFYLRILRNLVSIEAARTSSSQIGILSCKRIQEMANNGPDQWRNFLIANIFFGQLHCYHKSTSLLEMQQRSLNCEEKFVQDEVIVAGKKSYLGILTPAQQQTDILVATSLRQLSVNLRPDF